MKPYVGLPLAEYLEQLVVGHNRTRSFRSLRYPRSESEAPLTIPLTGGVTYGNRWFDKTAATLWNSLPVNTRTDKVLMSSKTSTEGAIRFLNISIITLFGNVNKIKTH